MLQGVQSRAAQPVAGHQQDSGPADNQPGTTLELPLQASRAPLSGSSRATPHMLVTIPSLLHPKLPGAHCCWEPLHGLPLASLQPVSTCSPLVNVAFSASSVAASLLLLGASGRVLPVWRSNQHE